MAQLRLSRAKYQYECDKCSRTIRKGQDYYRVEPFPIARIKGLEKVQHLCLACVVGEEQLEEIRQETRDWLRNYWIRETEEEYQQLPLWQNEQIAVVQTEVHVVNITTDILKALATNPDEIYNLTPMAFEELICNRLQAMGLGVQQVGHTFRKDGGIDIVAWPQHSEFPFLMAVQAKHHRSPEYKTGPSPVRELLGVVHSHPFNAGVLVTNTAFTPDARWVSEQHPMLVKLRDIDDIRRWLENRFLDEYDWRELPDKIEVCPGVVIYLPKMSK
jgi:hypothetical protein